jgi:IclR family pca regulon transcriptional regulator
LSTTPVSLTSNASPDAARPRDREFVQALERGFAVIKAFSGESPSLTITAVSKRTGLTRAVARRYLFTLSELGCVKENDGQFTLTPKVLDLGFTYLSTMSVADLAQPYMEQVVAELHESCSLSVLDGREVVYVGRVPAKRIMSVNLVVGSRLPAHATSMGKVLLAHATARELDAFFAGPALAPMTKKTMCAEAELRQALADIRVCGWALADQESEEGIRSVAAPVFTRGQRVVAAINVSAHASRVSKVQLCRDYLPVLVDAARAVSRSLGATVPLTIASV